MATKKEVKIINDIKVNYINMEKAIVEQLNFNVDHGPSIGGFREEIWKSLFEQIVPKKFSVERSVFIIDSNGHVSNEVDLAIFDEQYTPYIFRYGTLKFIPIEAIAVVIECKSTHIDKESLTNWVKSIDKLKTSFNSVARMATSIIMNTEEQLKKEEITNTQTSTRPIKILCYVKDSEIHDNDLCTLFDFIIQAKQCKDTENNSIKKSQKSRLIVSCRNDEKNLIYWHKELNHNGIDNVKNDWGYKNENIEKAEKLTLEKFAVSENTILTLIFQLNQLLMLINNPILFPHMSYVELFNNPDKFLNNKEIQEKDIINNELT